MKPIVQQLALLIVTLLNSLWTKTQTAIEDSGRFLQSWAEDLFVKKSEFDDKVKQVGDARYRKTTDSVDANALNGQTATQIKSDAYLSATQLVKAASEALRGRAADFALVALENNATYDFPTILAEKLGTVDDLDNGIYELRFLGGGLAQALLIDMPKPGNVTAFKNQPITNGDTVQFTVTNGAVTKLEFFNDTDSETFAQHAGRITDVESQATSTQEMVNNHDNHILLHEQMLNDIIAAAITTSDFDSMKAYIQANVNF